MSNSEKILLGSLLVLIVVELIVNSGKALSAYRSTLGNSEFAYRFDDTRLPAFICVLAALAAISFGLGTWLGGQADAVPFCLATTVIGGFGLLLIICYRPKEK
jgi:hypothetical protein